jgi:hypothetical protein
MMDMYGGKKTMGGKKKKAAAKTGMHKMPDGKMMKNSAMKKMGKKK